MTNTTQTDPAHPRTWLVTGSSRGLGRQIVLAALERGHQVLATARRAADVQDLVDQFPGRAIAAALDVTDADAARRVVDTAISQFGGLDVVVNNAGYGESAAIEDMPESVFRAQIETDLFGVVHVTRAALPVFRRQRSGVFVQFSSIGGRVGGTPGMGAYQTAKFGVEGFSEVLASEVAPFDVRVIIVEPGAFRTDWQGSSMRLHPVGADYDTAVGTVHEMRRQTDGAQPGDPARAAQVVVDVAGLEQPPHRLVLGADAVAAARTDAERRADELERWADLSASTAFPSAD